MKQFLSVKGGSIDYKRYASNCQPVCFCEECNGEKSIFSLKTIQFTFIHNWYKSKKKPMLCDLKLQILIGSFNFPHCLLTFITDPLVRRVPVSRQKCLYVYIFVRLGLGSITNVPAIMIKPLLRPCQSAANDQT